MVTTVNALLTTSGGYGTYTQHKKRKTMLIKNYILYTTQDIVLCIRIIVNDVLVVCKRVCILLPERLCT